MNKQLSFQSKTSINPSCSGGFNFLLHRACACGLHAGSGGECEECKKKRQGALPHAAVLQTKLAVNKPGDEYEQEADKVAHKVIRMPEPRLQRTYACGSEGSQFQPEKVVDRPRPLQAKHGGSGDLEQTSMPTSVQETLRSAGQPLDANVRAFMEPRFGYDFSNVRVHTDAKAAASARLVNALAYTVGKEVVFGAGQYAPKTSVGSQLMAHELVHVVQQNREQPVSLQRMPIMSNVGETTKGEAELPATDIVATGDEQEKPIINQPAKKSKPANQPCTRTILAEGSCADLVARSKYICCNPDGGIERKGKKTDIEGNQCPDEKFTPIFTCDHKCSKALDKGCNDDDNWMAIPGDHFSNKLCGTLWTICANGKQTTGYVRDRSVTHSSFEVSPGIQKALGVTVGSSFKGAVYQPGANKNTIDKDPCCSPQT